MAAQNGLPEAAAAAAAEAPRAGASESKGGLAVRPGCTCFLSQHCTAKPPFHYHPFPPAAQRPKSARQR